MHKSVRKKLINDVKLRMYLRDNSYYYKIINREPEKINMIENEMKDRYKLRFSDKVDGVNNIIKLLTMVKND